jgi:hypothetical protein
MKTRFSNANGRRIGLICALASANHHRSGRRHTENGDQTMVFDYFDYSGVPYDRADHDYEVSYYCIPDGGTTVMQSTVKLMDYLNLTNNVDVGSLEGATLSSL